MEDLVVPGAGSVVHALTKILQLCSEMKEAQEACVRLHSRLQDVFEQLIKMEKRGELPHNNALDKYVELVTQYLGYLQRYSAKPLVSRLIGHWKVSAELLVIQEDVATLFRMLNLAAAATIVKWKKQWEADRAIQERAMAKMVESDVAVLRELQDTRAQVEAVLLLKFEMERRAERQSREMIRLMKRMTVTVVRASQATIKSLPPWFLPSDDVEYEPRPFACGSFGSVHRGTWGVGASVVVKCLAIEGPQMDERAQQRVESEIDIWHRFNHPNVIKMFGASHVSSPAFIVCEDATNGNLCSFLSRSEANKRLMWRLLYQAGLGLDYVHRNSVVHGDLKLNNILVGADGLAKLSDFGLSAMRTCSTMSKTRVNAAPVSGGLRWRAPECLRRRPTFASDIYSFAMCMIEAVLGEPPFAFLDDEMVRQALKDGEIPDKPDEMSDEAWELVVSMTKTDPKLRLPLPRVLERLKAFAELGETSPAEKKPELTLCAVCFSAVGTEFAFCGRCGTPVGSTRLDPPRQPVLLDSMSPTTALFTAIATGTSAERELALSLLVRKCLETPDKTLTFQDEDVQALVDVVKAVKATTYSTQLHALECLRFAHDFSVQLRAYEFDQLRICVREPTVHDLSALMLLLKDESVHKKDDAAVLCGCMAALGNQRELTVAGVLSQLIGMLARGSDTQKQWAAYALGNLALDAESQSEIVRRGAVPPLVSLLQQGTTTQTTYAVFALGRLTRNNQSNCQVMAHVGVVVALQELRWHESTSLREAAASVLRNFDESTEPPDPPSSEPNQVEIPSKKSWKASLKRLFGGSPSPSSQHISSDVGAVRLAEDGYFSRPARGADQHSPWRSDDDDGSTDDEIARPSTSTRAPLSSTTLSIWDDPALLHVQVPFEEIDDIKLIGTGGFCVVYLVRYRQSQYLASKRLKPGSLSQQSIDIFTDEIKLVAKLEHPSIVKFVGAAWTVASDIQALFEYMKGGDLRMYLTRSSTPRKWSAQKFQIIINVIEAVVYMHSFDPPLIHRDLKARNVLLSDKMEAKLTDFGISRYVSEDDTMTANVGTRWLAPEIIDGSSNYNQSADIFSFGVMLSELDTHEIPYDDAVEPNGVKMSDMGILQRVANGSLRPSFSPSCPPQLLELAQQCLSSNPKDRPSAPEVSYILRTIKRNLTA